MVPCSTLTLSNPPLLLIPSAVALLTPSIVCPPRLSVMLLAPITRPSPGQFRRSFFTCVLCVITSPHVTFWASAGLAPTAKKTVTAAMRKPNRTSGPSSMRELVKFPPLKSCRTVGNSDKTRSPRIQTEMIRNSATLGIELTCRLHGHHVRSSGALPGRRSGDGGGGHGRSRLLEHELAVPHIHAHRVSDT